MDKPEIRIERRPTWALCKKPYVVYIDFRPFCDSRGCRRRYKTEASALKAAQKAIDAQRLVNLHEWSAAE